MATQYRCGSDRRRRLVLAAGSLNGIDYLVVEPGETTLLVHFLQDLPGTGPGAVPGPPAPALTAANVAVDGGARFPDIAVQAVTAAGPVLTVTVDRPGDYSEYRLRLRTSADDPTPPLGFDPQLSVLRFTFKVDCPSGFDCGGDDACPPEIAEEPELDYLAKDYASFRRLMLDRMSTLMPDWRERNPADVQIALVELLAYVGDHLSYFQDAVATEAYLGTARERVSIRRHARLLDYRMHDGCNARTWIHIDAEPGASFELPAGRRVLSGSAIGAANVVPTADIERIVAAESPVVFETRTDLQVRSAHNEIRLHPWSEIGCCLPAGATRATLQPDPGLALEAGDHLLFEEVRGPSGELADADPRHRQVVRLTRVVTTRQDGSAAVPLTDPLDGTLIAEIEWDPTDALTFPLCISSVTDDGTLVSSDLSVARGNIVLADHGFTTAAPLDPPDVPSGRPYRPAMVSGPLTCTAPLEPGVPAAAALLQDPGRSLPWVQLTGDGSPWEPRPDLLNSDRFATEFVAEIDAAGAATLRFGDGASGRAPTERARFMAICRVGNGTAGNVGADTLTRIADDSAGVAKVCNPLPAVGGTEPEPLERARLLAPRAFRRQERAVTEADYAAIASRRPDVGHAAGQIRWTGSWYTATVTVDRPAGDPVDEPFRTGLTTYLDLYRMAGVDLEVGRPIDVPLEIVLEVCAKSDYLVNQVQRSVLDALSSRGLPTGDRGFFHPDNWTFGQPLYLSQVYKAVMQVDGISWVGARRFKRLGRVANNELENGVLRVAGLEIVRLDNDPNFQEKGQLELQMRGGR